MLLLHIAQHLLQTLEDSTLRHKDDLRAVLHNLDIMFAVVFAVEMVLKLYAHGFRHYFSNAWNWLDAFIVLISIIGLPGLVLS